jgi:hypothetical protein
MNIPEIRATVAAIRFVRNPRYLATERGYHGAFYCALRAFFDETGLLSENCILEMEYQKSARHDTSQRPDIVFHIPVEVSKGSVHDNNFAVWALKRDASFSDARGDYEKLDEMGATLRYPLIIFVNVHSSKTHLDAYCGNFRERIHAFAVPGPDEADIHYSYFKNGRITHEILPLTVPQRPA